MWTLAFGHHEDRTPTHGYERTREAAMAAFARGCTHQARSYVRYRGQPGNHLVLSFTGFDPLRKSGGPKCCDAQRGFFNDVVGCYPRLEEITWDGASSSRFSAARRPHGRSRRGRSRRGNAGDRIRPWNIKEKPMKRETRITVTFTHPFQLKGIDRTLPSGDYTILTEEELTNDNASFPVYHRLSTVIFVSSKQFVEMFTIDPVDLQAALNKDVA
jgi:hypothetical protein